MTDHVILGTGPIARAILDELLLRGKHVRLINRSGRMPEVPEGVEVLAADLTDPDRVRKLADGAKVVYQCVQPRYDEWPQKFPALQSAILTGLTGGNAKLVIVENTYMYGETGGRPLTEDLPYNATTRKGRVRAQMARQALQAHRDGKLRVAIGRGSDYFGPWGLSSTMGERVFYPLLAGKPARLTGRPDLPHTHTYTSDFGRALVILGERNEADGQAWHVPNDHPRVTQGEMVALAAELAGVKHKASPMGRLMMAIGGLFVPEARETVEMMYEFEQPFVVDSSRFERTFGTKATPLREAMQATVDWFRAHPSKK